MADSDSEEPSAQKRPKLPSVSIPSGRGADPASDPRPQIARKLRKEKRQQKFLQKLDKKAYLSSQKGVNEELDKSNSSKKGKRQKNGNPAESTEDATAAEKDKQQQGRNYTVSI